MGHPFKGKADQRDNRALVYDGRVVEHNNKEADDVFKNTPIMQGRTEMAEMMAGGKMRVIEDVSATAVPSHTDVNGTVRGHRSMPSWGKMNLRRSWMRPHRIS